MENNLCLDVSIVFLYFSIHIIGEDKDLKMFKHIKTPKRIIKNVVFSQ
jgi:hypothetical protein